MRVIICLLMLSSAYADNSFVGNWIGIMNKTELAEKYSFWHELQWRYNLEDSFTRQVLWSPGLLYKLSSNESLGLYYGVVKTSTKSQSSTTEHRFTKEYSIKFSNLFTRFRLEERFLERSGPFVFRLRPLVGALIPYRSKSFFLISNELFINFIQRDWNGNRTFDRNRLFAGMRFVFEKVKINVGFLHEYVPRTVSDTHEYSFVFYSFF